jgi:hypothetical protein
MRFHRLAIVAVLLAADAGAFVPLGTILGRRTKTTSENVPKTTAVAASAPDGGGPSSQEQINDVRKQLEREIADAENSRQQVLGEISEGEARRKALEQEALKSAADAQAKRAAFTQAQQAQAANAAVATRVPLASAAPLVAGVGSLSALAFGRSLLTQRKVKLEEAKKIEQEAAKQVSNAERAVRTSNIAVVSGVLFSQVKF